MVVMARLKIGDKCVVFLLVCLSAFILESDILESTEANKIAVAIY